MATKKPVLGAFNQGAKPQIACFNKAVTPLGFNYDAMIGALQKYIDLYFGPVWNFSATLIKTTDFVKGAWAIAFLDDADVSGALAYHDVTPDGMPYSKVFVRTTIRNGEQVPTSASHELAEMGGNPGINLLTVGPDPRSIYALENSDPVQSLSFLIDNMPMADFVHPAYFEAFRKPGTAKFDHMSAITQPFQIYKDGYQIVLRNGRWSNIFGSEAYKQKFERQDRRGHRIDAMMKRLAIQDMEEPTARAK